MVWPNKVEHSLQGPWDEADELDEYHLLWYEIDLCGHVLLTHLWYRLDDRVEDCVFAHLSRKKANLNLKLKQPLTRDQASRIAALINLITEVNAHIQATKALVSRPRVLAHPMPDLTIIPEVPGGLPLEGESKVTVTEIPSSSVPRRVTKTEEEEMLVATALSLRDKQVATTAKITKLYDSYLADATDRRSFSNKYSAAELIVIRQELGFSRKRSRRHVCKRHRPYK